MDKNQWLRELANFIVEANKNTYAGDAPEVAPQRPGFSELEYISSDKLWKYRDSYRGYFKAPGNTVVWYKEIPVWIQSYGGAGLTNGYEDKVMQTYDFLKQALMKVSTDLPFRGPEEFKSDEGKWVYKFRLTNRDDLDSIWTEEIRYLSDSSDELVFTQTGFSGIIVDKNANGKPVLPWDA